MPQFDSSTFASQLFWLYVSFALLLILLSIFALPKIGGVLEARQKRIEANLDKAAQFKAEAEAAIAAYEKAMAESRAAAHQILAENARAIAQQAEARQKVLGEKLSAQIKAGEAKVRAARDEALGQIKDLSAELTRATLQRLLGQSVDDKMVEAAIKASLGGQG
jgi:F-type H+-transporting ATPase subunit b